MLSPIRVESVLAKRDRERLARATLPLSAHAFASADVILAGVTASGSLKLRATLPLSAHTLASANVILAGVIASGSLELRFRFRPTPSRPPTSSSQA